MIAKTVSRWRAPARLGVRAQVECYEEGALPRYESKAERVLVRERR
jgi:hypothetical protein